MKSCSPTLLLICVSAWAQPASPLPGPATAGPKPAEAAGNPPEPAPGTVLATFGQDQKLTYGDFKRLLTVLPPQMQQQALRDRKAFVQQFALMTRLAQMAGEQKLDEKSPTKEQLEFNRTYILSLAELNEASNMTVDGADVEKTYKSNSDRYRQVKVKVLYVSFTAAPNPQPAANGRKPVTEEQARVRIQKLLAEARGGTDFLKLVKENSEDETSRAKDGDFGIIRPNDNIPEPIRNAIFALKKGEISEPVRQPNGFYLFRAEEISPRPFDEVRDQIFTEIRDARFKAWMDQMNRSLNVKYVNDSFFNTPPAKPAGK
jgi:peptidyl-prolyl cis-trans isomerase C